MSDNNKSSEVNMNKVIAITGGITLISLTLSYLVYSRYYKEKENENDSDESCDDQIIDKTLGKQQKVNGKGQSLN